MNKIQKDFSADLISILQRYTGGCAVQHRGCPCRTCFFHLCDSMGLDDVTAQKFWDVVLILRGDYTAEQIEQYRKEDENEQQKYN